MTSRPAFFVWLTIDIKVGFRPCSQEKPRKANNTNTGKQKNKHTKQNARTKRHTHTHRWSPESRSTLLISRPAAADPRGVPGGHLVLLRRGPAAETRRKSAVLVRRRRRRFLRFQFVLGSLLLSAMRLSSLPEFLEFEKLVGG